MNPFWEFIGSIFKAAYWSLVIIVFTSYFSAACIAICLLLCLLGTWNWAGLMLGAAVFPWAIYLLTGLTVYCLDWLEHTWTEWRYSRLKAEEAKKLSPYWGTPRSMGRRSCCSSIPPIFYYGWPDGSSTFLDF